MILHSFQRLRYQKESIHRLIKDTGYIGLPCISTEVNNVPTMQKFKASMCRNPEGPTISEVKGGMIRRECLRKDNRDQNCGGDVNKLINN